MFLLNYKQFWMKIQNLDRTLYGDLEKTLKLQDLHKEIRDSKDKRSLILEVIRKECSNSQDKDHNSNNNNHLIRKQLGALNIFSTRRNNFCEQYKGKSFVLCVGLIDVEPLTS
jgi:hypothetical protein